MGMSQEQAAAALHAAKMAQFGAMGHNLDKLPQGLLPPQFDLSKINNQSNSDYHTKIQSSVTIEPTNQKIPSSTHLDIIKRDSISSEPMDLGLDNAQSGGHNDGGLSSGDEANYSDDEGVVNT